MTGEKLKFEIKKRGFTLKKIATELHTSAQNLGSKLSSDDVSSGLIEKIADIMGVKVSEFYSGGDVISAINNSTAFKGSQNCDPRLLDILEQKDQQINRLLDIIEKYELH